MPLYWADLGLISKGWGVKVFVLENFVPPENFSKFCVIVHLNKGPTLVSLGVVLFCLAFICWKLFSGYREVNTMIGPQSFPSVLWKALCFGHTVGWVALKLDVGFNSNFFTYGILCV